MMPRTADQALDQLVERVEDGGTVLGADVEPDPWLPARHTGHVAETTGGEAEQRGVLLGTRAGETHQGRRGEMWHVADDGDQMVVTFGVDRHRRRRRAN